MVHARALAKSLMSTQIREDDPAFEACVGNRVRVTARVHGRTGVTLRRRRALAPPLVRTETFEATDSTNWACQSPLVAHGREPATRRRPDRRHRLRLSPQRNLLLSILCFFGCETVLGGYCLVNRTQTSSSRFTCRGNPFVPSLQVDKTFNCWEIKWGMVNEQVPVGWGGWWFTMLCGWGLLSGVVCVRDGGNEFGEKGDGGLW